MFRTVAALVLITLSVAVAPAWAADDAGSPQAAPPLSISLSGAVPPPSRPAVLPALYVSYAALQVFDVYSTRQALSRGAQEANPLMQRVAGVQGAFWAVKASATAGTIVAAERLWKKNNKAAAIAVLVASNAVAATVAARNASVLRRLRSSIRD